MCFCGSVFALGRIGKIVNEIAKICGATHKEIIFSAILVKATVFHNKATELTEGFAGMYSVKRGPLLYALPIGEEWHCLEYEKNGVMRKFPYCDYEILPTTPFAFGFASDKFELVEGEPEADYIFSPEGAPVALMADLAPVEWGVEDNHCKAVPESRKATGAAQKMRLIPYGCTSLRMSVLPMIEK